MSVKCYCMMVYPFQVFNGKDLTEEMTKIQSVLSDDKNDWEHRVAAVSIKKWLYRERSPSLYERATLLLSLCHGIFTDCSILKLLFLRNRLVPVYMSAYRKGKKPASGEHVDLIFRWNDDISKKLSPCLWLSSEVLAGVWIRGNCKLKTYWSVKSLTRMWECSWRCAPDRVHTITGVLVIYNVAVK